MVVGDAVYTAQDVVISDRLLPFVPPVPGLRELPGVWTNREATGLREVPRRLLVLGAGPVGVEMGQAVARMGGSVAIVEGAEQVLPREPRPLGDALGDALSSEGIELCFSQHASAARFEDEEYVLEFPERDELRGDKLLVATGRRPRVDRIGLETVGIEPDKAGIAVDSRMSAGEGLWAIGDAAGIWPLTYVGKYQGRVVVANVLGEGARPATTRCRAWCSRILQAAAVGAADGALAAAVPLSEVPRTATYMRDYERPGLMALVSDGERVTGAYAARAPRRANGSSRPRSPSAPVCRSP